MTLAPIPAWGDARASWPPDPLQFPESYRGVTSRRVFAYFLDFWILLFILAVLYFGVGLLTVMSLGLLSPLHLLLVPVPLLYHSLQMSGPYAATLGMRAFGLEGWSVDGGRPDLLQALVHAICFYLTLAPFAGLLLLVALFNPGRRTLHDFAARIVILRRS